MSKPSPKPRKGTATAERRARRRQHQVHETQEKLKVRLRDVVCRFPWCGCIGAGGVLEVSHRRHKGMGGNPAGDRSTAAGMVLLCAWRHREGRLSVDRGTVKWEPLWPEVGADGPIAWYVAERLLPAPLQRQNGNRQHVFVLMATESHPGWLVPPTKHQRLILAYLATMQI